MKKNPKQLINFAESNLFHNDIWSDSSVAGKIRLTFFCVRN